MEKEQLLERINEILLRQGDSEAQHSMEDKLHIDIIKGFCPDWVIEEVDKLSNADFERWCA